MIRDVAGALVVDIRVRNWCKMPYPGHPKGCPNYNKSATCPEKVGLVSDIFNLKAHHWFLIEEFYIGYHAERMKDKHPKWSDRQCRCVLYWQGGVRSKLKKRCEYFISEMGEADGPLTYTLIPEAMGVNVFRTCHRFGIKMRKNPQEIIYKVALVGFKKER